MFIDAPPFLMEGPYLYSDLFCDRLLQSYEPLQTAPLCFISSSSLDDGRGCVSVQGQALVIETPGTPLRIESSECCVSFPGPGVPG